jgi:hypothetical protein
MRMNWNWDGARHVVVRALVDFVHRNARGMRREIEMPTKKAIRPFLQQGDVILDPLSNYGISFPDSGKPLPTTVDGFVVAKGSSNGNEHAIPASKGIQVIEEPMTLTLLDGTRQDVRLFIRVTNKKGARLTHNEHGEIFISTGDYVVRPVREFDHLSEEARNVAD